MGEARALPSGDAVAGRLWAIAAPIRAYVRRFPVQRGKGFLIRRVLVPMLPRDPAVFVAQLPGGGSVTLRPRETLGFATLIFGGFETAEICSAIEFAAPGTTAFDVGANVGMYSVAMGRAVGTAGRVVAVEPDPTILARLRNNLTRNSITNVYVVEGVAGEHDEAVELHLADDPAYNSIFAVEGGRVAVGTTTVQSVTLDRVWERLGRPAVSFVKIDVEGAEVSVLRGARAILAHAHPVLLVEARDAAHLELIRSELGPLKYRRLSRRGFQPWNHMFVPADGR